MLDQVGDLAQQRAADHALDERVEHRPIEVHPAKPQLKIREGHPPPLVLRNHAGWSELCLISKVTGPRQHAPVQVLRVQGQ